MARLAGFATALAYYGTAIGERFKGVAEFGVMRAGGCVFYRWTCGNTRAELSAILEAMETVHDTA